MDMIPAHTLTYVLENVPTQWSYDYQRSCAIHANIIAVSIAHLQQLFQATEDPDFKAMLELERQRKWLVEVRYGQNAELAKRS
jgi:hypothetical protein